MDHFIIRGEFLLPTLSTLFDFSQLIVIDSFNCFPPPTQLPQIPYSLSFLIRRLIEYTYPWHLVLICSLDWVFLTGSTLILSSGTFLAQMRAFHSWQTSRLAFLGLSLEGLGPASRPLVLPIHDFPQSAGQQGVFDGPSFQSTGLAFNLVPCCFFNEIGWCN